MRPAELRKIRGRLGLTQAKMARMLGLSLGQYGAYENGRQPIRRVVEFAVRWVESLHRQR